MFAASAVLATLGSILNKRYANNFTKALLGTGCGAFFIAIQMTHLYFSYLNDVVAFTLLLAWLAGTLVLLQQTQSLLIGVIAHVGMILSVCFGYAMGMSADRILLLMAYQLIATVFIVVGNLLWCKRMYRFGLFASLALTVFASSVMTTGNLLGNPQLPLALSSAAFILQFLGSSFLAYLLFMSIARLSNGGAQVVLQVLNLTLWVSSLLINITNMLHTLFIIIQPPSAFNSYSNYPSIAFALSVTLVILYAIILLMTALHKRLKRLNPKESLGLTTSKGPLGLTTTQKPLGLWSTKSPLELTTTIFLICVTLGVLAFKTMALAQLLCISAIFIIRLTKQDIPTLFLRIDESLLYVFLGIEFSINTLTFAGPLSATLHLASVLLALLLILDRIRLAKRANPQASAQLNPQTTRTLRLKPPNTNAELLSALSLHGLVIVIICVLKLLVFDLGGLNTTMRVVAFIGGGIICFGISALYNFAVKHFYNDTPQSPPNLPTQS